jgi:toxin-antitoxin system PIN domain toxin
VTLVDTNLLVYATFSASPEHSRARDWLSERVGERDDGLVWCWPVLYAFLRLITSSRVMGPDAVALSDGWEAVDAYLSQPGTRVVAAGAAHRSIAAELARTPGLRSDDVPDVEIAALAIEHGLVLATHDHGFRRFAQLRMVDPLV